MITLKRGFGIPKTLGSEVDRFKARTPQGALVQLARLTQERQRLQQEMERWEHRMGEIRRRLREIAEMEAWLHQFVDTSPGVERTNPTGDGKNPSPVLPDPKELTFRY